MRAAVVTHERDADVRARLLGQATMTLIQVLWIVWLGALGFVCGAGSFSLRRD